MTLTYEEVLSDRGITVPDHLLADAEVPILTGVQRQGDLIVVPLSGQNVWEPKPVPAEGVAVVRGENGGHTHHLSAYLGEVTWAANPNASAGNPTLGVVDVPEDAVAYLTHDDEHGASGIGPGRYAIKRQVEEAEKARLVAD